MAKYYSTTLQKGSKGDEVKEWQNFLNSQGYNLSADGIFGGKTYAATLAYQKDNGLTSDGIVGDNTWSKAGYVAKVGADGKVEGSNPTKLGDMTGGSKQLFSDNGAPIIGNAPTLPTFAAAPTLKGYDTTRWDDTDKGKEALKGYNTAKEDVDKYNPYEFTEYTKGEDVLAAEGAYNGHLANKPGEYQSQWQSQLDSLMNSIMNRDKFSYNMNEDALYQQYKDKYIQQGKMAMADTMGQAAAMTGGYGSSYAQSVGQQAYQAQLQNLNDIVPQLYAMALDQYNREGQDLYNQYGLVMDRENTDYGRYMDTLNTWMADRGFLAGRVDSALNFDYGQHMDTESIKQSLSEAEYARLMDAIGLARSDYYDGANIYNTEQANTNSIIGRENDEALGLWEAGNSLAQQAWQNEFNAWDANTRNLWTQAQWDEAARQYANEEAWRQKEWALTNAKGYHESGGKVGYDNGSLTDDQIKEMQNALGINADGKWGSGSTEAAGGLTADEAWKAYKDGKLGKSDLSYGDIVDELNYYISQGADKSEINNYLREAYQSGYISYEEYNKLKEAYAPRGYTYGITTQATPAIK